jgi:cytidylate kinase
VGEVVVVTGPPGAGKSAVAERLVELFDPSALVAGDDFFAFLRNGAVAPWLEAAHDQNAAVIAAAAAATGRLAARFDVVYDGVLGPWFLAPFLASAGLGHLHYVVLLPPLGVCLERVRSRRGHGFTDLAAAEQLWGAFHRSGLDPRHVVSDPDGAPAAIAEVIARRVGDETVRHPWGQPRPGRTRR